MARQNPITSAPFASDSWDEDQEPWSVCSLRVAGNKFVLLMVKVVLEHRVYIAVKEERYRLSKNSRRDRVIKRGAVLVANRWAGRGEVVYAVYNGGIYDALRAVSEHIPDTETAEIRDLQVSSGSLEMALALTWSVRKSSPPSQQDEVRRQLLAYTQRWRRWQNRFKIESLDFMDRAADRIGVIPYPALSPMIGAAERRLTRRQVEVREIVGRIGQRHAALLVVFDQAWRFQGWLWREFNAMAVRLTAKNFKASVPGAIKRLRRIAHSCRRVSLAPFGRRTFNHIAGEAEFAAAVLERNPNDRAAAVRMIERSMRSIYLMTMKRAIIEVMTMILALKRLGQPHSRIAVADFVYSIEAARNYMSPLIDSDFVHPVTPRCVAALDKALEALRSPDPKRLDLVYKFLRQAQEPI